MLKEIIENYFSNLLVNIYIIYALVSFLFSFFFVLLPLNRLRIDWMLTKKDGKLKDLRELFKESKSYKVNAKKVRNYLFFETILSLFPLIAVIVIRIVAEPSNYTSWNNKIMLFVILLSLVSIYNLKESIDFSRMISPWLQKNRKWYQMFGTRNPTFIYAMLSVTKLSRDQLKNISKLEIPEHIESKELDLKPMRLTDMDNKVDTSAVVENLQMIGTKLKDMITNTYISGKKVTKDLAIASNQVIGDKIDQKISDNVEYYTKVSPEERLKNAALHTTRILFPVIVMYLI